MSAPSGSMNGEGMVRLTVLYARSGSIHTVWLSPRVPVCLQKSQVQILVSQRDLGEIAQSQTLESRVESDIGQLRHWPKVHVYHRAHLAVLFSDSSILEAESTQCAIRGQSIP